MRPGVDCQHGTRVSAPSWVTSHTLPMKAQTARDSVARTRLECQWTGVWVGDQGLAVGWCSSYVQPCKGNRRLVLSYFCQNRVRLPVAALATLPSLAHVPASPKVSRVCGGTPHFPSNSEDCVGHVWPEPRQLDLLRGASVHASRPLTSESQAQATARPPHAPAAAGPPSLDGQDRRTHAAVPSGQEVRT